LDWTTHAPQYLVPPCTLRSDGRGPVVDLGLDRGDLFLVTLGINHVAERQCLTVTVRGSADGAEWGDRPLIALPQKCYCGVYSTFLDLSKHPQVRYLQVQWTMTRWGKGDHLPLFGFSVTVQESKR
jgi:hypothetical protein